MKKHFNDVDFLITGGASGTDEGMEYYVEWKHGIDHVKPSIKPDWARGGALARNVTLAKICDRAIGIWCVASMTGRMKIETDVLTMEMNRSGTLHSIIQSIRYRKPLVLYVVLPDGRYYVMNLRNDIIPDGCDDALRKGRYEMAVQSVL